jgi:FkbM family methyltransferase
VQKLAKLIRVIRHVQNWPTFIFDYLKLIPRGQIEYQLRNGAKFNLQARTYETIALAEVWMDHVYTPNGDEIKPDSIVVDLGANVGLFTVLAGRLATRGKVYAFEPMPVNFANLKQNIELNALTNIIPLEAAWAGATADRDLFADSSDTVSHSLNKGWSGVQPIKVHCFTAADAMRKWGIERIDFLKVDVEAAEMEIFSACTDEVFRAIGIVSMEVHEWPGSDNNGTLRKMFEAQKFKVVISPNGFVATNTVPLVPLKK